VLCGEMEIRLSDFYEMTPKEFFLYREGFIGKRDADAKFTLVTTRKLMFASIMPHARRGLKETDIMEFEWENDLIETLTEEEINEQRKEVQQSIEFWKNYDLNNNRC
jgi:hypothetical protein